MRVSQLFVRVSAQGPAEGGLGGGCEPDHRGQQQREPGFSQDLAGYQGHEEDSGGAGEPALH